MTRASRRTDPSLDHVSLTMATRQMIQRVETHVAQYVCCLAWLNLDGTTKKGPVANARRSPCDNYSEDVVVGINFDQWSNIDQLLVKY